MTQTPSLLHHAVALHQAGRLSEAERAYQQVLAADPRNFAAQYQLALSLYQQGRMPEAQRSIAAALALDPESRDAMMLHGAAAMSAGDFAAALDSLSQITTRHPADLSAWHNRAVALSHLGRFDEAVACFDRALALGPTTEGYLGRGAALLGLHRPEEALICFDKALTREPENAVASCHRGNAFSDLGRFEEAVAAYDATIARAPDLFDAWSNRGLALYELERFSDALASYDRALGLRSDSSSTLTNRGIVLFSLRRFEEALAHFERALEAAPQDVEALRGKALVFRTLHRLDEALACVNEALALRPHYSRAVFLRGWLLCEVGRIAEGLDTIQGEADRTLRGEPPAEPVAAHAQRHSREQREYLSAHGVALRPGDIHFADGGRVAEGAVKKDNAPRAAAQWADSGRQLAVIDDFLNAAALEKLRRYCWGSTVWRKAYPGGYVGAFAENGFACPLLAQIAEELTRTFPDIIGDHRLRMLWGFMYDSRLKGIGLHADQAAVNVNFWITANEANLDPDTGGMVIWDAAAPDDWDIKTYNGNEAAVRDFLRRSAAKPMKVPHGTNRAVIFDSDLFHETDVIDFKEGYQNRRINVTMLFGRRTYYGD